MFSRLGPWAGSRPKPAAKSRAEPEPRRQPRAACGSGFKFAKPLSRLAAPASLFLGRGPRPGNELLSRVPQSRSRPESQSFWGCQPALVASSWPSSSLHPLSESTPSSLGVQKHKQTGICKEVGDANARWRQYPLSPPPLLRHAAPFLQLNEELEVACERYALPLFNPRLCSLEQDSERGITSPTLTQFLPPPLPSFKHE